jgi:FkbM family methyltransferase
MDRRDEYVLAVSAPLRRLFAGTSVACVDVGARGGIVRDLAPIAPHVDAIGFEPDPAECARLNADAARRNEWRSLRYVAAALGARQETRTLHLHRDAATSSILEADAELARRFSRADYAEVERDLPVELTTFDSAAARFALPPPRYMKLDVQGFELEVLAGAAAALASSVVALRIEVEFLPLYRGQPLFEDVVVHLREFGFEPVEFVSQSAWRRFSRSHHPLLDQSALPYSKGQLAHADLLFLRREDDAARAGGAAALLALALLAIAYEHLDVAEAVLSRAELRDAVGAMSVPVRDALLPVSVRLAERHARRERAAAREVARRNRVALLRRRRWFRLAEHALRRAGLR